MSKAIENLILAQQNAMKVRPEIGGFPYLAESLRRAGVTSNIWFLPSCQSIYLTNDGPIVTQGKPLINDIADIPLFNRNALIRAIRIDQEGKSTFLEFLESSWRAGVIRYEVNFVKRTVTYYGCLDEEYLEEYPAVDLIL
ncbi:MAG: DUF1398 family protein [Bdellovibrionota bacterium]